MNRIIKLVITFFLGAGIGFLFPMVFIYLDLNELSMDWSIRNIIWVVQSQNMITFSFYALPLVFAIVSVLFMLNLEKNKEIKAASLLMANMAHAAGMGEIAAEVIHNIGNVLTSVFASIEKSSMIISRSKYNTAKDAEKLLIEKKNSYSDIFVKDEKLGQLLDYYVYYTKMTVEEFENINEEMGRLRKKIDIIRDILMTQKSYAYSKAFSEKTTAGKMIEASIRIFQDKLNTFKITLKMNLDEEKTIDTQSSKVVNILSNLVKNAIEAMEESLEKLIEISTENMKEWIKISVRDTGPGISDEKKKKIFNYGYTTKNKGAGLGLHSCYNLAVSLGGKFEVVDPKEGAGVVFNLYLPVK